MRRNLRHEAKLSIYWSIYVPTLTYGHKIWVMTERMSLQIQVPQIGFLLKESGLRDKVRNLLIRKKLGVEVVLLRIERSQLSLGIR